MIIRRCITPVLVVFAVGNALGNDFYVAPSGSPQNNGTIESPWDLQSALKQTSLVKPGDTIWLRAGRYVEPSGPRWYFRTDLAGAPGRPITIRAYPGERATIDGGFEINGAWTVWRDLEVFSSDPKRTTTQSGPFPTDITRPMGFNVFGPQTKIINNVVHDTFNGVGLWQEAPDSEAYGNLIYYSGWIAPDRGHGHGIYVQNATGSKRIADNILFQSFDIGLQGSGSPGNNNLTLEGNILFQGGVIAGAPAMNLLLSAAARLQNPLLRNNYTYFAPPYGRLDLGGLFGTGCSNLRAENNYFADGYELGFFDCTAATISGNLFYGNITWRDGGQFRTEQEFRTRYPGNTYQGSTRPTGVKVVVRPNQYQAKRANIVIYNWDLKDTVDVDVSAAGLAAGDSYELRSAQDYYGDVLTGTYTGRPITISMRRRSMAQPVGRSSPESTLPEFGVFILAGAQGPERRVAVSADSLNFQHRIGDPSPARQTVTVSSDGGPVQFTVTTGADWLAVSPNSGSTPAVLSFSVNPAGLTAGNYSATARINAAGAPPLVVNVNLAVRAAILPEIASTVNAASVLPGPVAPGEIITLYGQNLGPAVPSWAQLSGKANVGRTLDGTRVLFDGIPAPVLYASADQVNAIVPFSVTGRDSTRMEVEYAGQRSTPLELAVVPAAPALFTQDSSGLGPGLVLNEDFTMNSAENPAKAKSILMLFATGAGPLDPEGTDDKITEADSPPRLALPVSVFIGGQEAEVLFAGAAPEQVAGMAQFDVRIPDTVSAGTVPVEIVVGGVKSPPGVTVAVR